MTNHIIFPDDSVFTELDSNTDGKVFKILKEQGKYLAKIGPFFYYLSEDQVRKAPGHIRNMYFDADGNLQDGVAGASNQHGFLEDVKERIRHDAFNYVGDFYHGGTGLQIIKHPNPDHEASECAVYCAASDTIYVILSRGVYSINDDMSCKEADNYQRHMAGSLPTIVFTDGIRDYVYENLLNKQDFLAMGDKLGYDMEKIEEIRKFLPKLGEKYETVDGLDSLVIKDDAPGKYSIITMETGSKCFGYELTQRNKNGIPRYGSGSKLYRRID